MMLLLLLGNMMLLAAAHAPIAFSAAVVLGAARFSVRVRADEYQRFMTDSPMARLYLDEFHSADSMFPIPAELAHAPFDSDGDATPDTPAELEAQFKKYHPLWASTLRQQQLGPGAMILGNALGDVADPSLNGITIEMLRCADNVTACAERFIAQDRASSSAVLPGTSVIWMDSATLSADEQCRVVEEVRQRCPFVQPGTDFYDGSHVVCGGGGHAAAAVAVGMKTLKTDDDDSDDGSFMATTKEVPSTPTVVDKYIFVNASTLALVQKSRLVLNRPQRATAAAVKPEHEWERWGVFVCVCVCVRVCVCVHARASSSLSCRKASHS